MWTALHHWGWWRGSATMCVGFGLRLLGRRMCWIDLKFDLYTVVGSWPTLLHHATTKKSEDLFGSSFTGISHNCGFMSPKGKVETWKNSWIQVGPAQDLSKIHGKSLASFSLEILVHQWSLVFFGGQVLLTTVVWMYHWHHWKSSSHGFAIYMATFQGGLPKIFSQAGW